jgi:hypothetical protein
MSNGPFLQESLSYPYTANLIHRDSRSVLKVVRYGLNILCLPDEHAVELVEKQIARQREQRKNEE